jgi:WD40 repeat protein
MTTPPDRHSPPPGPADELAVVHRRIARNLSHLATAATDNDLTPPHYLRRHLAEHAAAGGVLDDATLPTSCLPYIDVTRLRQAYRRNTLAAMPILRRATHEWDFDRPASNRAALQRWSVLLKQPQFAPPPLPGEPRLHWAHWPVGHGEILAHTRLAAAGVALVVAAAPDGRTLAVTRSSDGTVRVWNLNTGDQVGQPLTGPGDCVVAMATVVTHPAGAPSLSPAAATAWCRHGTSTPENRSASR